MPLSCLLRRLHAKRYAQIAESLTNASPTTRALSRCTDQVCECSIRAPTSAATGTTPEPDWQKRSSYGRFDHGWAL